MRELTLNEVREVNGGIGQEASIAGNLSIIGIGVGIMVAGATAPAWFAIGMIAISVSFTASYIGGGGGGGGYVKVYSVSRIKRA